MTPDDPLISIKKAADLLGIRDESVRAAIAKGRLPCHIITVSRMRVRLKDVEAYKVSLRHQRNGRLVGQAHREGEYIP